MVWVLKGQAGLAVNELSFSPRLLTRIPTSTVRAQSCLFYIISFIKDFVLK